MSETTTPGTETGGVRSTADRASPLPAPRALEPTWATTKSEPSLSPAAAAVLQSMRDQVRSERDYRRRILDQHPAPTTAFDDPPHPDLGRVVAQAEARIASLEDHASSPAQAWDAATGPAPAPATAAIDAETLHRISTSVFASAHHAHEAVEGLRKRVRMVTPGAADPIIANLRLHEIPSSAEAGKRALAALGQRGYAQEREQIAHLAGTAWEARARLDRLTERAAEMLEMRRGPGLPPEVRVDAHEVLREVERRRGELYRASLEARAAALDRAVLPQAQPRMQEKKPVAPGTPSPPQHTHLRSIDCLRCGTTAAREDGRSRLAPDGTPRVDADGQFERPAPRDGEFCTPCWLHSAPMSVPELQLAQRRARLLEATQLHYAPGTAGWNERAAETMDRDHVRRGMVSLIDERLDAPSPWLVQPSPAEVGDRRLEELIELETQREELLDKSQWDIPTDRESSWWDLKFSGMFSGEPEPRAAPTPEERLHVETSRLAEAQRRLLTVVGTEDSALRRVLEIQATVRLHLAQGGAVRAAWEETRGIGRAEARAVAREEVRRRFLAPDIVAHHERLRQARGLILPRQMDPQMQAAIRARQVERILADLDVPTLVRRLDGISRDASPETAPAIEALRARLDPALEDTRLQGVVEAAQLAETARQDVSVRHSGVDEAVLPGERRAEGHERSIDRWLDQTDRAGALGPEDIRTARGLSREVGELNPRRNVMEHFPAEGERPWQLLLRDAAIAGEVRSIGQTSPDRIIAALEQYRTDALARGADAGEPFDDHLREQIIEAAARQSGFTQAEVDRLWEINALTAAADDPAAFDHLMREAGAWMADPERNNDPARLRDALELRTDGGARVVFSDDDLTLVARAELAAAPYTAIMDRYRAEWQERDVPAATAAIREDLNAAASHPAVREAISTHEDVRVAELASQVAAKREFERIDPHYQEAKRHIDRAETILGATGHTREAAQQAWTELEETVKRQFTRPEMLLERVRAMDADRVRQLADQLRTNPLALAANHPRTQPTPRIPGVNGSGTIETFESRLKTVRAPGLRGLMGQTSATAIEHQARVAAVALETWAEARQRGEQTRSWAAPQLGLPADTPLSKVYDHALQRLAALKTEHRDLLRARDQLAPAPTAAQIERRLKSLDPATAELARRSIPDLATHTQRATRPPSPERAPQEPSLSR